MNDPTYVEAARKLAERIMHDRAQRRDERIEFAFRLATARPPSQRETDDSTRHVRKATRSLSGRSEGGAGKLLADGEAQRRRTPASERAGGMDDRGERDSSIWMKP